jgi:hypothetical protein
MEIFSLWKRGWREKLSRGNFGARIRKEAFVLADSSNPSIA